jgi:TrmH family RNA methyltransferase
MIKEIASSHNPNFRRWSSLLESKGIRKEGLAILSGEKLVKEWLEQNPQSIEEILLPFKGEFSFPEGPKLYRLANPLFKELDSIGTKFPLAIVRTPEIAQWNPETPPRGLELIVAMSDPSNLGAVLRSSEAFGASRVILTRESSNPFLPKALKASSLSALRVKLASTVALADLALGDGYALDMSGTDISKFKWPRDLYLVLGEEGRGVPDNLALKRLKIPMTAASESLNATVAGSIALFSYRSSSAN